MPKKLNHDEKRALQPAAGATFVREYNLESQKGIEPNDRRQDRRLDVTFKKLPREELDRLRREPAATFAASMAPRFSLSGRPPQGLSSTCRSSGSSRLDSLRMRG